MKNDHARIGIAVHEAIEQFTRRMQKKQSFPDASDYEFAVTTFMNTATSEGLEDMGFYSDGRIMVNEYIDRYDPSEEVIAVEKRFKITTPDGVPITGAIDKVVKINEDTIAIVDYKTSRNAIPSYELETDVQLSMYDFAGKLLWPEYKNRIMTLDYVRINKQVSTFRSDADRESFNEFLNSIWLQMQKIDDTEAEGRLNKLCGWCDYQGYCPTYAEFLQTKLEMKPLTEMTDDEFIEHWELVAAMNTLITARQRELKMIASRRFMQGESIESADRELYSVQGARTVYPAEKVMEIVPMEDLRPLLNVHKARLDKYLSDFPDLKDAVRKVAQVNYNAPMFKTRAVKREHVEAVEQDESAA
jgi:hypothetical protein